MRPHPHNGPLPHSSPSLSTGAAIAKALGATTPGGGAPMNDFFGNAAQSQAFSMGMSLAGNFVEDQSKRYIPWFTAFWRSLKYYFAVNHQYVLLKLKTLLFPFNKRQWTRLILDEGEDEGFSGSKHARPINDENAPDLYIPVMAFVTYILLTGYVKGTKNTFTPEVLVQISSSCLVTQLLEVFLIKLGLYFLASSVNFLDLVAFTGYKYVALNLNMLLGLFVGPIAYTLAMLYTGTCMFFVMLKTMAAAVLQRKAVDQMGPKKEYVLMMWGFAALQFLTVWWLGYSRDLKR